MISSSLLNDDFERMAKNFETTVTDDSIKDNCVSIEYPKKQ